MTLEMEIADKLYKYMPIAKGNDLAKDITALLDAHVAALGWKVDEPTDYCTYFKDKCKGADICFLFARKDDGMCLYFVNDKSVPATLADVLEGRARKGKE